MNRCAILSRPDQNAVDRAGGQRLGPPSYLDQGGGLAAARGSVSSLAQALAASRSASLDSYIGLWALCAIISRMTSVDLLSREVYTYAQIDDLLGLRTSTARRWIDGYTRSGRTYSPVIREMATGSDVATWGEFVECRFLAEYREAGVPLVRMRPVVDKLRRRLDTRYPLASSQLWLEPQGRELVARVQSEVGLEPSLLLVRTDEHQLPLDWTRPSQRFQESIDWSTPAADGSVQPRRLWVAGTDRQVVIDPLRAFGEPVVRGVETAVLAELVRAGDPVSMVAELYDLTETQVAAAVQFEERRAA